MFEKKAPGSAGGFFVSLNNLEVVMNPVLWEVVCVMEIKKKQLI